MILPGATLGMLGGGQLGAMFTLAARSLGYHVIVLDPDPDSPAGRVADEHIHAGYVDDWALDQLAGSCAAITTEFENIPAAALRRLAAHCPVRPSAQALEIAQERLREKAFIRDQGLATARFAPVRDQEALQRAFAQIGAPAILKRSAFGYDGKGQYVVDSLAQAQAAFAALDAVPCVLEQKVTLAAEVSVVVARNHQGQVMTYPVAENRHHQGILDASMVPARVAQAVAAQARDHATALAHALDYCGVMAVEFFLCTSGELLVNEIAPRPHNSGHYTLDACVTSQFEQQVRMVCGLPFGDTRLLSPVVMVNLLGDLWAEGGPHWPALLSNPAAKLHLYGKREARPGRKMGHYCVLAEQLDEAIAGADAIMERLRRGT